MTQLLAALELQEVGLDRLADLDVDVGDSVRYGDDYRNLVPLVLTLLHG